MRAKGTERAQAVFLGLCRGFQLWLFQCLGVCGDLGSCKDEDKFPTLGVWPLTRTTSLKRSLVGNRLYATPPSTGSLHGKQYPEGPLLP